MALLARDFLRTLAAIRRLCGSDVEAGNAALPALVRGAIAAAASGCVAAAAKGGRLCGEVFNTLATLASCVYEVDEGHAPALARALMVSFP